MTNSNLAEPAMTESAYKNTGVDSLEADAGLIKITERITKTWPETTPGKVKLEVGQFANVIDIGNGTGLAICTDGVGSKTIIAEKMDKYDTIGIDCVAMNVNDLICVGARPLSMVDYIAVEHVEARVLDEIAEGLCRGAELAGISITGGETSQLPDVMNGFDLVGTAVGLVDLEEILVGKDSQAGDVVIGIRSNGVHSNGLTLARHVLLDGNKFQISSTPQELDCTLGEELLKPTDIYVPEAMQIIDEVDGVRALVNITSDGLLNLTRSMSNVGYVIDNLPKPNPVFGLIQRFGKVSTGEMFEVFNMGIGFCVVTSEESADQVLGILEAHGRAASVIGRATDDPEMAKKVSIPQYDLLGKNKTFKSC